MLCTDRYPIVVTSLKDACRDYWVQRLGFTAGFDSRWFTWLTNDDGSASIAFMTPDHPSAPPGPEEFSGRGLCFELQVADVDAAHAAFVARGGRVDYGPVTEPFGQRRFGFADPSGLWVDVVQQVAPADGWWDRYLVTPDDPGPAGT
jgi:predicted enzyme related to lactoylglutathione lyase